MRPADLARNIARDIKRPMLGEQIRHMGKVYLLPVDLCKKREKRSSYCLIYVRSAGEERLAIWTIKLFYGQTNSGTQNICSRERPDSSSLRPPTHYKYNNFGTTAQLMQQARCHVSQESHSYTCRYRTITNSSTMQGESKRRQI
jgi:hypothetical protein